jgi:aminoglycoside phosphotransferase (APT) family kinase protein
VASLDPELLARAAARVFGEGATVDGVRRLSGGASRETWSFDLRDAEGTSHALVLRRDPGAHVGQSERATEYALLTAAAGVGVPVPRVRFLLEPDDDLGRGFVMDHVEGETIARRILRDDEYAAARPRLASQCGEIAARIHAIAVNGLPPLELQGAEVQIQRYIELLDISDEPHPAFELARQWLLANAPPDPTSPQLVHGDFRNGNFIVGADGIRSVLDWELTHLGNPVEDLGWLCVKSWRFGMSDRVVGGFGDVEDLLSAYERAGGRHVEPDELRYWVVLGTLKWGVICVGQAFTHLNGIVRSVELATLGRRVAEMEWDILDLLDGGW